MSAPDFDTYGVRNRVHNHAHDGTFSIETYQDVAPYLEQNKRELNAQIGAGGRRSKVEVMRKVASIPPVFVVMLLQRGINVMRKEDDEKLFEILNDPEFQHLRTTPGRI